MAEAIGVVSGVLTLAAFAHKSVVKVQETVESFRSHPRLIRELLNELGGLKKLLEELSRAPHIDAEVDLSALQITLEQCSRACDKFETELVTYIARSSHDRASFRDWARFTYRGGDGIEGFRQQLIGYKSTINIALSFANLRTSTITVEAIRSCRGLIEMTTVDLEAHLAEVKHKLDALTSRPAASTDSDVTIIACIEDERLSTEKGLQLCQELSKHIDDIQHRFTTGEQQPSRLFEPYPNSKMLVNDGLNSCKEYLDFSLQRLKKHQQKVADRSDSGVSTGRSSDDKLLLDSLSREADMLQRSLKFCSNVDTYLEERISNIENHAEGDDTIQIMVSTDGRPISGRNRGIGLRLKQAGGHFDTQSLQQVSSDFKAISIHDREDHSAVKPSHTSEANSQATSIPSQKPFSGRGFTLAQEPGHSPNPLGS
ncbi:hypothetical protein NW762_012919 [Fusarium torreyae]|uniref:Azaphilone pigments biosynthesis cluster protein L N-terminal domain-containing protein n=1 Tax=Fusarium torreyae TaxID=1237075 RepID=A0A9W8RQC9_9HYPO|nr:hypothetical protein NW762_012919 [Fusarium torreyae]